MPDQTDTPQTQTNTSQSWWTTLPGVLTALATLIGAITGLYLAIKPPQPNVDRKVQPPISASSSARPKSDLCDPANGDNRPVSCFGGGK
jgi:hypothetical protein